jgi:ribosomal protein S21
MALNSGNTFLSACCKSIRYETRKHPYYETPRKIERKMLERAYRRSVKSKLREFAG